MNSQVAQNQLSVNRKKVEKIGSSKEVEKIGSNNGTNRLLQCCKSRNFPDDDNPITGNNSDEDLPITR